MLKLSTKSEDVAAAVVSLLARNPPRKGGRIVEGILALCKDGDAEAVLDCIYRLVSPVETLWTVARCPSPATGLMLANSHFFIESEYNRLGDSYRCPVCNEYVLADKFVGSAFDRMGLIRQIESAANCVFSEYAEHYYGKECTTLVYAWECDTNRPESTIGLAVLLRCCLKSSDDVLTVDLPLQKKHGVWQSAHVGVVDVTSGSYRFQSSFYLDVAFSFGSSQGTSGASVRFNGNVASRLFCFERHTAVTSVDLGELLAAIGEQIQATENNFHSHLPTIYFTKAQFIAQNIRVTQQQQASHSLQEKCIKQRAVFSKGGDISFYVEPCDAERTTDTNGKQHPVATEIADSFYNVRNSEKRFSSGENRCTVDDWIEVYDDLGNHYYHYEATGEIKWEKPTLGNVVLVILQGLHLAKSPEKYYEKLRNYFKQYDMPLNNDTFLSLMNDDYLLEMDDGSKMTALEYLVPLHGDRRKIEIYIAQNAQRCAE